jgi:hypothetical protein
LGGTGEEGNGDQALHQGRSRHGNLLHTLGEATCLSSKVSAAATI